MMMVMMMMIIIILVILCFNRPDPKKLGEEEYQRFRNCEIGEKLKGECITKLIKSQGIGLLDAFTGTYTDRKKAQP